MIARMRRADRLFLIVHALQGRRSALPARALAEQLGVSLRTVYRDVADLQRSGVPIEGEAGIGYLLRKGVDIPPLMFNADELEALVVGIRFVRAFGGEGLARSAQAAMTRIEAVLPPSLRERSARVRVFAPRIGEAAARDRLIEPLHAAIGAQRVVRLRYRDLRERTSVREIEPLCLAFWGDRWTLGAWCRLRGDFRNFRPDRIVAIERTDERFEETAARGLDAYLRAMEPKAASAPPIAAARLRPDRGGRG